MDQVRSPASSSGHVYLVVSDEAPEFEVALHYACRRSKATGGHVAILKVIGLDDFQDWGNVEAQMMRELRMKAEETLWQLGGIAYEQYGQIPAFYIAEGEEVESILKVIEGDSGVFQLILGANPEKSEGGPLVRHFSGKGLAKLRVPLVIVPSHMDYARAGSGLYGDK
jgi:hypothetical protein